MSGPRPVRAPRGTQLTCKSWQTEAAYRMIQNNLDPEVAEKPDELVTANRRETRNHRVPRATRSGQSGNPPRVPCRRARAGSRPDR